MLIGTIVLLQTPLGCGWSSIHGLFPLWRPLLWVNLALLAFDGLFLTRTRAPQRLWFYAAAGMALLSLGLLWAARCDYLTAMHRF